MIFIIFWIDFNGVSGVDLKWNNFILMFCFIIRCVVIGELILLDNIIKFLLFKFIGKLFSVGILLI